MHTLKIQDGSVLSTEAVGSFRPLSNGKDRMIELSDGSLLLINTRPDKPCTIFRVKPNAGKVSRVKAPIVGESWVVSVPPDRLLIAEPNSNNAVLWNAVTGCVNSLDIQIPRGNIVCADAYKNTLYIIVNWNVSGCGGGFEWSDDDTYLAAFDMRKERFSKPFQAVEDNDMRAIVMQSNTKMVGFGYGRSNHFCGLFNRKLERLLTGPKHRNAFSMTSGLSVDFVGTDEERALILFGQKGNAKERVLIRWTLANRTFELVDVINNTDLFFQCSTSLKDGSILLFCWERHTSNHTIFRYEVGKPLRIVGRLLDTPVSCAAQGSDDRIYVAAHGSVFVLNMP